VTFDIGNCDGLKFRDKQIEMQRKNKTFRAILKKKRLNPLRDSNVFGCSQT